MTVSDDYDDPAVEAVWHADQRKRVRRYLYTERQVRGLIPKEPIWSVAPYVAVWLVRGRHFGQSIWVISGDLPTDYMSQAEAKTARDAVRLFASRWKRLSSNMEAGRSDPDFHVGHPHNQRELARLLVTRARLLGQWADSDDVW